jgi:tricorn protease-like protein
VKFATGGRDDVVGSREEVDLDQTVEMLPPDVEDSVTLAFTVEVGEGWYQEEFPPGILEYPVEVFEMGTGVRVTVGNSHDSVVAFDVDSEDVWFTDEVAAPELLQVLVDEFK